eukprot:CAMPEP_0198461960 /NCGR_PEP_ID=MMETSP1456-20131121/576_1 /TAXON_ID=1461544 ORGANISM="Unidentified sp., Strain RCC1871" /NCGR_SAMPLE_ID=MMETSP1456 /ASSEMBLY_ACC=CAM_ASM_001119 /LENGTH=136 /DNA_ID=CAMNT_0044187083 /DNA_START=54 /DNA_END=461 /DNA_ORIENTATION=-
MSLPAEFWYALKNPAVPPMVAQVTTACFLMPAGAVEYPTATAAPVKAAALSRSRAVKFETVVLRLGEGSRTLCFGSSRITPILSPFLRDIERKERPHVARAQFPRIRRRPRALRSPHYLRQGPAPSSKKPSSILPG